MLDDIFRQELSFVMTRGSSFSPDIKINDKVHYMANLAIFLNQRSFATLRGLSHALLNGKSTARDGNKSLIFFWFGNLVNCKQYFKPTGNLNLIEVDF